MKTSHPDLFPETLLVSREGDRVFTTSLKVAEHFRKQHKNVLRDIEKLLADLVSDGPTLGRQIEFSRLNFEPRNYQYVTGRNQVREAQMYVMTEEGFALLAMGFTGKEALAWKVQFLAAFRDMQRQLYNREASYAAAFDRVRPFVRPVVEATERGLSRAATAEPLGKSPAAVTYHRRQARRFGLLDS